METIVYAHGPQGGDRAPPGRALRCTTRPIESLAPNVGKAGVHLRTSVENVEDMLHLGSVPP